MEQKPLGRTGRTISAIGLGCVTFGREIDEDSSYRVLDHAMESGITFLDTAEGYGGGQSREGRKRLLGVDDVREKTLEMSSSELIVGRWLRSRGCRDQITVGTKVSSGGGADNIPRALSASLERLGTDHVDIYKMHSPDTETPIAETLAALSAEVEAGRVSVIGGSNYSAPQLREALNASATGGHARFEVAEPPYNIVQREAEDELFPICQGEGIAVTSFSPLAAGFLTGKYTPDRSRVPAGTRFDVAPGHIDLYFSERNFKVVDMLRDRAAALGLPMARLAMAWAMKHPAVTSVLVGARTPAHVDNALAAFEMRLDPDLRAEMSGWTGT